MNGIELTGATQRTSMAWTRTALTMLATAATSARFLPSTTHDALAAALTVVLLALGAVAASADLSASRHAQVGVRSRPVTHPHRLAVVSYGVAACAVISVGVVLA